MNFDDHDGNEAAHDAWIERQEKMFDTENYRTKSDVQDILDNCSFQNWQFFLGMDGDEDERGRLYLQVKFSSRDANDHDWCSETHTWSGRKWFLSPHMTKSEIVQTAFKAVLTAVEHETREMFTYMGAAIFGPHLDVDRLAAMATSPNATDKRK